MAGLDRFALLLLAGQPCQPQLVMDPDQRVRLHRLIVICHDELCAPRPVRRMPPLQKPSVSGARVSLAGQPTCSPCLGIDGVQLLVAAPVILMRQQSVGADSWSSWRP